MTETADISKGIGDRGHAMTRMASLRTGEIVLVIRLALVLNVERT